MTQNVDPAELEKFSALASKWWDPNSEFRPLHQINPLRLDWIDGICPLTGKIVIDVGCGGGILAEAMARKGGQVKGIDLAEKSIGVARCMAWNPVWQWTTRSSPPRPSLRGSLTSTTW